MVYLVAVIWTILCRASRRCHWPRTVRAVLARQILFTGVEALSFVALIAGAVGISVVVQAQLWMRMFGQTQMLGPVLVMVIVREAAPLLVNFIVIGRSGAAMAVEMANMKVSGEVNVLESQGIDTLDYLAMPRVLAMAVSIFCLTMAFILISFVSGYACGILTGVMNNDPEVFVEGIFKALGPGDIANVLAKTLIPGLLTAAICVMEGLNAPPAVTWVPIAASRAVVRSIAALFVLSAIVSILTYI